MRKRMDMSLYGIIPWMTKDDEIIDIKRNNIKELQEFDVMECEAHLFDTFEESMLQLNNYLKIKS